MLERMRRAELPKERSSEEAAIQIETEVIKRTELSPEKWIEKYGAKYRALWDANREQFLELEREKPEELYGLISQLLESEK